MLFWDAAKVYPALENVTGIGVMEQGSDLDRSSNCPPQQQPCLCSPSLDGKFTEGVSSDSVCPDPIDGQKVHV